MCPTLEQQSALRDPSAYRFMKLLRLQRLGVLSSAGRPRLLREVLAPWSGVEDHCAEHLG
jgi:hypothetical protein